MGAREECEVQPQLPKEGAIRSRKGSGSEADLSLLSGTARSMPPEVS